ncbi:hypothetical protein EAI_08551 [Harpegnathos saltator]|uniref:Uncharacterized protein n=1 Tax=Harpegnathos saltator TaxID=610380 RepID=E2C0M5_HARSA|nr:hypothetical protein EAI_08551 [Harpegnathos saltator]
MTIEARGYAVPSRRKRVRSIEPEATRTEAASSGTSEMSVLQDVLQEIRAMKEQRQELLELRRWRRTEEQGQQEPNERQHTGSFQEAAGNPRTTELDNLKLDGTLQNILRHVEVHRERRGVPRKPDGLPICDITDFNAFEAIDDDGFTEAVSYLEYIGGFNLKEAVNLKGGGRRCKNDYGRICCISVTCLLSGCVCQDLLRFCRHSGARLRTAESATFLPSICHQTAYVRICYVSAVILVPDCAQQNLLHFCRQSATRLRTSGSVTFLPSFWWQTAYVRICYVSAVILVPDCAQQNLLHFCRQSATRLRTSGSVTFLPSFWWQTAYVRICYVSAVILVPDCAQQNLLHFCRQSATRLRTSGSVTFLPSFWWQTAYVRICYVSAVILVPDCAQHNLLYFCYQSAIRLWTAGSDTFLPPIGRQAA